MQTPAKVLLSLCLSLLSQGQEPADQPSRAATPEAVILPRSTPDPIEPLNRAMWEFNKALMGGVIKPTSAVYRFVVVKPVRTGIGNIGRNLTYPGRLINHLLQGRWHGARDESYRFACNTTIGVAGFFDVAGKWGIPRSEADFGQTFGHWGWKPGCFVMMPLLGPSNERDILGLAADTLANPLLYISPYDLVGSDPLTYLGPYTYFTYVVYYNDLSDSVREYVRFSQAEMDPYAQVQYAWTFARATRVADLRLKGDQDPASLETLNAVLVGAKSPAFLGRGKTRSAFIPSTGRRLKYTSWMQPGQAPVVYVLPGLGSHRLAHSSLALAELAYGNGFSVVCISSAFHSEFMEHASTADIPAYLPTDGKDVHVALTEVDRSLESSYPGRLGAKALMGYSMGGFHSLFLAATAATNGGNLLRFDRYVAINSPVRLLYGVAKLDEFYGAPLDWPTAERASLLENTFLKVNALSKDKSTLPASLPFSAIESKFLIGLTFRLILRDIIYSSQYRNDQAVLQHSMDSSRRKSLYQEILQYSYQDYFQKFAVPFYRSRGVAPQTAEALDQAGDLRTYTAGLRGNSKVRFLANQNDFLLASTDFDWIHATFPPEAVVLFDQGGHLGNLSEPLVQKAILNALAGLKPAQATSK